MNQEPLPAQGPVDVTVGRLEAFDTWALKAGFDTTRVGNIYEHPTTVAALCGYEAGLREGKMLAHLKVCDVLKSYGIGDGSVGWIEHTDARTDKLARDPLNIEGEVLFGIEAIIEKAKAGGFETPNAKANSVAEGDPVEAEGRNES